jgi:restriction endonuclease Mrr
VDLLLKMGYGGSRAEADQAIGKGGGEGIDGVISQGRLGLDTVYLQAKRWEGSVGRPAIQRFVGALARQAGAEGRVHHHGPFTAEVALQLLTLGGLPPQQKCLRVLASTADLEGAASGSDSRHIFSAYRSAAVIFRSRRRSNR